MATKEVVHASSSGEVLVLAPGPNEIDFDVIIASKCRVSISQIRSIRSKHDRESHAVVRYELRDAQHSMLTLLALT